MLPSISIWNGARGDGTDTLRNRNILLSMRLLSGYISIKKNKKDKNNENNKKNNNWERTTRTTTRTTLEQEGIKLSKFYLYKL